MSGPIPTTLPFRPTVDRRRTTALHDRFPLVVALLAALLVGLFFVSLLVGSVQLSPQQVMQSLLADGGTALEDKLLWNLRLPRTLLAMLVGLHFAAAGLILQAVIRNPLADPGVIGVSSGASLAVVTVLLLADLITTGLMQGSELPRMLTWLPIAALIGGLGSAALVLGLSWRTRMSPAHLALNGVAVGAVLHALVMWVVVAWGGARTEIALIWLAGSLYGRDFVHLQVLLPWSVLGLAASLALLRPLSLLRFDDALVRGLGLHVLRWRLIAIAVAVVLAASATAVAGPIGFIGLVVPHLARLLVGADVGRLLVASLLAGALLTLAADIVARTLISPLELPVGALTTLIGIPVFLLLLLRRPGMQS